MKKILTAVLIITLSVTGVVFVKTKGFRTIGLTKVESFNYDSSCLAMSAECGVCYGKEIDRQCYVDKGKLTKEQLSQMRLE